MRHALIACIALLVVGLAAPAAGGQEPAAAGEMNADGGTLPVSLDRIRHRMASLPAEEDRLLLRLTTRINVYARAQAVAVLQGFNVESWTSGLGGPDRRRHRVRLAHPQRNGERHDAGVLASAGFQSGHDRRRLVATDNDRVPGTKRSPRPPALRGTRHVSRHGSRTAGRLGDTCPEAPAGARPRWS